MVVLVSFFCRVARRDIAPHLLVYAFLWHIESNEVNLDLEGTCSAALMEVAVVYGEGLRQAFAQLNSAIEQFIWCIIHLQMK